MAEFTRIKNILDQHYSLGELVDVQSNYRGYINESYEIKTLQKGRETRYLLRWFHPDTSKEAIKFELELYNELQKRNFELTPGVIQTKDNSYYAELTDYLEGGIRPAFVTIFTFLPGEDKYEWNGRFCTEREIADAAQVLALYHQAIHGWSYDDEPKEPSIIELMAEYQNKWEKYSLNPDQTEFGRFFSDNFEFLSNILDRLQRSLTPDFYNQMPKLVIHGDFHPGNMKFQAEKVMGLFDPDWSRTETRCFDIALAANYFCTSWEEGSSGEMSLELLEVFLRGYQDKMSGLVADPGRLNNLELRFLPQMIQAGNLYLIDWTLDSFYQTDSPVEEYLGYLKHMVHLSEWIEENAIIFIETTSGFKE